MFHHRFLALTTLVGVTATLSGCFSSDDSPTAAQEAVPADDQAAIQAVMAEDSDAVEYTSVDVFFYDQDGSGAALAPINTHRWRREPLDFERTVEILIEQSSGSPAVANVTATGSVTGLLHLWACADSSLDHVTKDFWDSGQRQLMFERVRENDRFHRGWKLTAISGVEIASESTTRRINSVRVVAGDVDETITSVSDLVYLDDLLALPPGMPVDVTVDTGDATDAVFLHVRRELRLPLVSNGDGTFSGSFLTIPHRGPRHFVVDVLSNGTLYDDTAAYDNVAWGVPYLMGGPRDGGGGPGA